MPDMDTGKPLILKDNAHLVICNWFESLQQRDHLKSFNGRLWRAELRRSTPPWGAITTAGYFDLAQKLERHITFQESDRLALAIFAYVAAHADKHDGKNSFAWQLAETVVKGNSFLSPQRFKRLLAVRTPEEFCRQLTRAVRLRGNNGVNIVSMADGILKWMRELHEQQQGIVDTNPFNRIGVRWASEYMLATNR